MMYHLLKFFWRRNLLNTIGYQIKENNLTTRVIYSLVTVVMEVTLCNDLEMLQLGQILLRKKVLLTGNFQLLSLFCKRSARIYNVNVTRLIEVGSRTPHVQNLALEIFDFPMSYNVKLQSSWIPRKRNDNADIFIQNN